MSSRLARWGVAAALPIIGASGLARGQTTQPANSVNQDRLDRFERRLHEVEQENARLREELRQAQQRPTTAGASVTPASASAPAPAPNPADDIERAKQDILKDIQTNRPTEPTLRIPASFNPDLAVIGNFRGNVSTDNDNPARNRWDLDTLELEMRAAVDPRADAVAVIPFTRDVDDPLFFNPADANGDVNSGVEIEEAYLFLHDFGVPNLTAKLGRFHLRFGRWNVLHNHDWPTAENNFAQQSFLAPESITDNGLSLSYVIPPKYVGDQYIEAIAETITGEGDPGNPVMNNNAFVDSPALNTHLLWNHDIGRDWNVEVGGSWLTGKHNNDNEQNFNLYGTDVTLLHVDPTGGFFNQVFQAEAIYGDVDTSRTDTQHAFGAFVLLQQQLNRDWYVGTRLDWTKSAVDDDQEVWGVEPYVTWYWSEFLRFRMEYQHKQGDTPTEDTLWFQVTWVFGAHPPHPYWSMK